jgi:hypothetical protein
LPSKEVTIEAGEIAMKSQRWFNLFYAALPRFRLTSKITHELLVIYFCHYYHHTLSTLKAKSHNHHDHPTSSLPPNSTPMPQPLQQQHSEPTPQYPSPHKKDKAWSASLSETE